MSNIRVRIAPSPTGDPHVGTAYVALFNYVFARKHRGQFILRIEDTDRTRARSQSEAMIMDSLKWLGLDWDEGPDRPGDLGPYRQSERSHIYRKYAAELVEAGHAYRCFLTPEQLEELRRQAKKSGAPVNTNRFSRNLTPAEIEENLAKGKPYTVRLKMPLEGKTTFIDELRGEVSIDNKQIDDQILLKSDGFPTYHLANVVDDYLMKISHVIRAEEWISSTPKHVQLYRAFGWEEPKFVHLPLIRNQDKSKISKRKNPVSLRYYQKAGILPEAMLNFLGLMGWSLGDDKEVFSLQEMMASFELKQISLGGPVFDQTKLNWLNQQYVQHLSNDTFVERLTNEVFSQGYLKQIAPLMRERVQRFDEFVDKASFFFNGALSYEHLPILPKGREKKEFKEMLNKLAERLDSIDRWKVAQLEETIVGFKDELGWKPKEVFMPLRLICTGRADSPPLYETLEVLGSDIVRFRIRDFVTKI